jgi:DNA replication protein DnaC
VEINIIPTARRTVVINPETKRKARELNWHGFDDIADQIDNDASFAGLSFDEKMTLVVDHIYSENTRRKIDSLIKSCKLRIPNADIVNIDYDGRPLSKNLINELATCQFVKQAKDIVIEGFTGTGKSYLACALAKQACKNGLKSHYVRMPDMFAYREERMSAGWNERKVLKHYASYKVLVLDEWLVDEVNSDQLHFLMELTELRYDNASTIYCSQYPTDVWHKRLGSGIRAEAIMDRIVHNAFTIEMGVVNMRERLASK